MASVASQLIKKVTVHVQRDRLEDAREICADGTYFLNNLRMYRNIPSTLLCTFLQSFTFVSTQSIVTSVPPLS